MPLTSRYGKTTKKAQMQDLNDGKTRRVASGSAATASPSFPARKTTEYKKRAEAEASAQFIAFYTIKNFHPIDIFSIP